MHVYICKQLLIKYQRCRINYRKSEKRVPRNYSERTNWFINLNYYYELTELFEFIKRSSIHNIFFIEKYFGLSQNLESTCIYMYMYKYYFLNEKKLHSRTCAFHMLHDCYYTRGTASIVKKERLFIFTCTVSASLWRKTVIWRSKLNKYLSIF